jgi:signal transduction histidine kinase
MLNIPLFEWVIENLCKNAVDAMSGKGELIILLEETDSLVRINVTDTGKGIAKSNIAKVFNTGFTTKKRGWGLGLSLSKRIIKEYHGGKIYVKHSQIDKGTTFSIELKKK